MIIFFENAVEIAGIVISGQNNNIFYRKGGSGKPEKNAAEYLHFQSIDSLPVQNLIENLIWSLLNSQPNRRGLKVCPECFLMILLTA